MMNFKYYVVEFQESPHASVPRFVCIPTSWIRTKHSSDRRTAVAFPEEQFVATVGRIMTGEQFNDNWPLHIVTVKFGCDNLEEGQKYAVEQCSAKDVQENVQSNQNIQNPQKRNERPIVQVRDNVRSPQRDNSEHKKKRERISRERKLLKRLSNVFKEMHEGLEIVTDTLKNINESVDNIKTSCKKSVNLTDEFLSSEKKMQHTTGTRTAKKLSECGQKSYEFPDNSDTDSKWTLRFSELQDGLTELLPGSKVYVRIAALDKIKTEADNDRNVAVMLMEEIFSFYALCFCSLAGGKGGGGRTTINKKCRPPLDEYSRNVLMMYLKDYASERGWPEIDERDIWMTLRRKLLDWKNYNPELVNHYCYMTSK